MDQQYWNQFYESGTLTNEPSFFAKEMLERYITLGTLLELGCGNGRDSLFFAKNHIDVTAIDESKTVISRLKKEHEKSGVRFISGDFVTAPELRLGSYDYIYSRFTMHSITKKQEDLLLKNVYDAMKNDGMFFIEARTIYDELYGKGESLEHNAFLYNGHYRRFLVLEELLDSLQTVGFQIIDSKQEKGFAPFQEEDPVVLRIVAKK